MAGGEAIETSFALLCLMLYLDAATFAFATTPLLLLYGRYHAPWMIAVGGGLASALGGVTQLLLLRWVLRGGPRLVAAFRPVA